MSKVADSEECYKELENDSAITLAHFEKWIFKMVLFERKSVGRNHRNFLKERWQFIFAAFWKNYLPLAVNISAI